jgi:PAS domain S-box-containing protein
MTSSSASRLSAYPYAVQSIIALSLVICFGINLWALLAGVSIVVPHLFYVPIILAAFFYPRRGVAFALVLSAGYFLMVAAIPSHTSQDIVSAIARCIVFAVIAFIVSFLSERVGIRERELVRAREQWENTFNSVPDLIAIIGTDHRILRINKAMADSIGLSPDQATGMLCYEVVHASGTPPERCPHALLLKDKREHTAEIHEDKLGGDFLVTVSPLYDEHDRLVGSIHVARDITERKIVETELLLHSIILENMAEGVALVRAEDRTVVFANPRFSELFGYREGDLAGQLFGSLLAPRDGTAPDGIIREIERALAEKGIWSGEIRNRRKDGSLFLCRSVVTRYNHPTYGKVWITVQEDITEHKRIETALRESEERLQLALSGADLGTWYWDIPTGAVALNQRWAEMLGYTLAEIDPHIRSWERLVNPDDMPHVREVLEAHLGGKTPSYECEYRLAHKSGAWIWVLDKGRVTRRDGEGKPLAAAGTHLDITRRRQVEDALSESEEKYRTIINEMQDIFYRTDTAGKITMLSPSAAKLTGYDSLDQLLGQDVTMVYVNPSDRDRLLAAMRETGAVYTFPIDLKLRDGTIRHVTTSSHFHHDAQGRILGVEGVIHDITRLRETEDALRESEERYRTIIETIEDVFFRFDREGLLVMASPSAAPMFGYGSVAEMIGLPASAMWKDPAERLRMIGVMKAQGGLVHDWEAELKKQDGTVFWASISGHMHFDESGKYQGKEGIIRDITGRKKMEDALKTALTKLNMLSSITRHDILNQIMGLRTFLELSREDLKGTRFEDYLEKGDEAAGAIQRQIEFTKFYQDIGVNAPKWQNANEVIGEAAGQLGFSGIGLEIAVGDTEIFADPLIVKVFFNLMENSIRHGERVTKMSFTSRDSADGLVITYRDNGTGISAEDKKNLFRKGFGKHTGLGLFLSREILAITGITITENGEPGKGVQFEMTVPFGAFRPVPAG